MSQVVLDQSNSLISHKYLTPSMRSPYHVGDHSGNVTPI